MTAPTAGESVRVLMAAAGLAVSDTEFAEFVEAYPKHRADLDALYEVPMVKEEEPQVVFSPLV
jgi:hypothetical protein